MDDDPLLLRMNPGTALSQMFDQEHKLAIEKIAQRQAEAAEEANRLSHLQTEEMGRSSAAAERSAKFTLWAAVASLVAAVASLLAALAAMRAS